MKLAIFCADPMNYDGKNYTSNATITLMISSFPKYFERVDLLSPVLYTEKKRKYVVNSNKINVVALPFWGIQGIGKYIKIPLQTYSIFKIFVKKSSDWDLFWIVGATALSQIAFLFCKIFSVPSILYLRGDEQFEVLVRNEKGLKRILANMWASYLNVVIPLMVSSSLTFVTGQELYRKYYKKARGHLYLFVATLIQKKDIYHEVLQKVNLDENNIQILTVGHLSRIKGLSHLIDAVQGLRREKNYNFTLSIVGDGNDEKHLRDKVKDLDLDVHVRFLGYIPYGKRLLDIYRSADIFVLPSISEGTPKVIPEALASGLPLIASNVGGLPNLIRDGENGFLVSPGNSQEIRNAVLKIVSDKNLRFQMIKNCLWTAESFTLDAQMKKVLQNIRHHYPQLDLLNNLGTKLDSD